MSRASRAAADPRATLDAWRAQGDDRVDRAGFARIDALERRTAAQHGELRRVLDARLRGLIDAYAAQLRQRARKAGGAAKAAAGAAAADADSKASGKSRAGSGSRTNRKSRPAGDRPAPTLSELTQCLQATAATREAGDGAAPRAAFPQLAALDEFRMRWSRVRMDRQVRESLEQSPADAGPLNSGRLVHRALNTMQTLAPEYLQQFMAYVDALAWMERLGGAGDSAEPAAAAPAAKRSRKRREPSGS